ncbi:MFS transporter [Luteolibacter sp. Populi]|uniref:MFS transporter n=1 Tax=Luteolibacter sp. Populi TaxID=3230487 RepID=UPI0034655A10
MANLSDNSSPSAKGWWSQLAPYQRLVFIVATLAWLFDCLDQQLFNLARSPAMKSLLGDQQIINLFGKVPIAAGALATSIFVIGWATGGMIFGSLGDRYGRAKMLSVTVLLYSIATGLSALSVSFTDFAVYRFLTGLGVGGVFGLAVALVADTVPSHVRPRALGVLQSFSAVGNVAAGFIGLTIALTAIGEHENYWKWLFVIGALPAFLVATIQLRMKEPPAWTESRDRAIAQGKRSGSYRDLFGHATWRRHALLGMVLSCAGVIGLWGIGVFSSDLVGDIVTHNLTQAGATAGELNKGKQLWMSLNLLTFNVGAFAGMLLFTRIAEALGRKKAFAMFFAGSLVVTIFVFQMIGKLNGRFDILWMAPLMGFFHLSVFAGFSIYLPELFPTRLRATGVSFCYNVGRYLAALGPFTLGALAAKFGKDAQELAVKGAPADIAPNALAALKSVAKIDAFRDAASWMCLIFLLGIIVLPFLPETKGQPLPED